MSESNLSGSVVSRRLRPFLWTGEELVDRLNADRCKARAAAIHVLGDAFEDEIYVGRFDRGVLRDAVVFPREGGLGDGGFYRGVAG